MVTHGTPPTPAMPTTEMPHPARDEAFITEFSQRLGGLTEAELATFFDHTLWFLRRYAAGCQLPGPIFLVLDNSLIQDFKHRSIAPARGLRALAYTAFCRFVTGWSDRATTIVLSPMAVYEHLGRTSPGSVGEAAIALRELLDLLADTRLRCAGLGFNEPSLLLAKLKDIEADERYLTDYVRSIDAKDWKTNLHAPLGVKIPFSIAWEKIPDSLPLRYFDSWYVKFVLSARIEQFIVQQSRHDPKAKPISGGRLMQALADLNEFSKKGLLKGLGDIDLLQHCDVSRQYKENPGCVLLGQTLDKGLDEVLGRRHVFHVSDGGAVGGPEGKDNVRRMVDLMFSNPFAEEDRRGKHIQSLLDAFQGPFITACQRAQAGKTA